jgi:hypothetical protein
VNGKLYTLHPNDSQRVWFGHPQHLKEQSLFLKKNVVGEAPRAFFYSKIYEPKSASVRILTRVARLYIKFPKQVS